MKITNTKDISQNTIKCVVFGASGAGKTTLAKTIEEPTLIISAESGLLSLAGSDIDVIDVSTDDSGAIIPKEKRIARLYEIYKFLQLPDTQKKYKWIYIDSLSEILQNLAEELQLEFTEARDTIKMWGEYAKRARALVKSFRDLPGYNVVFTALATEDKDDLGKRFIRIDVNGKIAMQMPAFFDLVLYLFIQDDKRMLLTSGSDRVIVKDRSGKLSKIEEPNLAVIAKKIRS